MGRLLLILAGLLVCIALGALVVSVWKSVSAAGTQGLRRHAGIGKDGVMAPTTLQKAAYAALIVLLFGTATGWLGGL